MQLTPETERENEGLKLTALLFPDPYPLLPSSDTEEWEESSFQELTITSDDERMEKRQHPRVQSANKFRRCILRISLHTVVVPRPHNLRLIFPVTINQHEGNV